MTQPQYKLEELKIFHDKKETTDTYSDIYDGGTVGIFLDNVSTMPACIKKICENSINNSLMEINREQVTYIQKKNLKLELRIILI